MASMTPQDKRKRRSSQLADYSASIETLRVLQTQLNDSDVADEEMLRQLARLSSKLQRPPRREPEPIFLDPFDRAVYNLEIQSGGALKFKIELQEEIAEQSRALGSKHAVSSDTFNGLLDSLRDSLLESRRSSHCWVELYLTTQDVAPTPSAPLDIYVVSLRPSSHAGAYQIVTQDILIPNFCGMLVIRMDVIINLFQAILELAKFAKRSREQTLRGAVTDGFQWRVIMITWDDQFLSGHYRSGIIRSNDIITDPDVIVGVLHHWVTHLHDEVGEYDNGYFNT
ncbi:hypothetical protein BDZ89DRAFT_716586 [Hymenopellis radicata]|nr:hypothetical protein BDZ89DRAFT_716586 [Hymenopellis radicata]